MKTWLATLLVILGLAVGSGALLVMAYFNFSNTEIRLRNKIEASQKVNETVFDTTWKIISQQAQVADKYKESFKDIFVGIMDARYSKGDGSLMKWITETNPQFDPSLYTKLANSIEVQRTTFQNEQAKLLDLKREHDDLIGTFPGSVFLMNRSRITVQIVTSTKTDKAFSSGKDDDIEL